MTVVFRNNFTAADGTSVTGLSSEALAISGAMEAVSGVFTMQVTGNRARANVSDTYAINDTPTLGSNANYIMRAAGQRPAGPNTNWAFKMYGRVDNAANDSFELYSEPSYLRLKSFVSGVGTVLGDTTAWNPSTTGVDYVFELRMNGSQISVAVDGSVLLGPYTVASVTTAGRARLETAQYTSNQTTEGWHWNYIEIDAYDVAPSSGARGPLMSSGLIR